MIPIVLDMPWYVFALLGALFVALASVLEKYELTHDEPLHFSTGAALIGCLLSLLLLPFADLRNVTIEVLGIIFFLSFIAAGAFSIISFSTKRLGVGETSALLALSPVMTAVLGVFLLGEFLSLQATCGILLAVVGLFFLESRRFSFSLLHWVGKNGPLVLLTLLAVFGYSLGTIIDRTLLTVYGVQPLALIVIAQCFIGFIFIVFSLVRPSRQNFAFSSLTRHPGKVVGFALLMFLSRVFYAQSVFMAYSAFASALKRSGAVLTVLFAGALFKEKHLGRILFSVVLIVSGALLIIFSK